MKCVLCGRTSIDVKIDQFPLSPEAREMLKRIFGINPDEVLANSGVCRLCLALPFAERNKLAEKAIKIEQDEHRRQAIQDTLKKNRN
jgi:hypothetical protein